MTSVVEVRAPGRLHLGMFSFGQPEGRGFGGVGVMVDQPGVHVRLRRADALTATGPAADRAVQFAQAALAAWGAGTAGVAIDVLQLPRSHVGLGSGTQLALAVAAGVRALFEPGDAGTASAWAGAAAERGCDTAAAFALARVVGRGRRSCVGIHGFSGGGLIVEAGRLPQVGPSAGEPVAATGIAVETARESAPLVARVNLPSAWRCVVIIDEHATGLHGEAERNAFRRLPPVPVGITAELARIALLELLPAAIEGAFDAFARAVGGYGRLAGVPFAPESAALPYAAATDRLLATLAEAGAPGCAQSSWGPAVMACCASQAAAEALVATLAARGVTARHAVTITPFASRGAVVRVVA